MMYEHGYSSLMYQQLCIKDTNLMSVLCIVIHSNVLITTVQFHFDDCCPPQDYKPLCVPNSKQTNSTSHNIFLCLFRHHPFIPSESEYSENQDQCAAKQPLGTAGLIRAKRMHFRIKQRRVGTPTKYPEKSPRGSCSEPYSAHGSDAAD